MHCKNLNQMSSLVYQILSIGSQLQEETKLTYFEIDRNGATPLKNNSNQMVNFSFAQSWKHRLQAQMQYSGTDCHTITLHCGNSRTCGCNIAPMMLLHIILPMWKDTYGRQTNQGLHTPFAECPTLLWKHLYKTWIERRNVSYSNLLFCVAK